MLKPNWSEYLEQLRLHKPSAPAIFNLIYMGAMDEFIEAPKANNMPVYALMVEQVKRALKSKAGLSKGYKTDSVVLADVKSPLDLIRWRIGYNPISKSNLIELYNDQLTAMGFRKNPSLNFPYAKNQNGNTPAASIITKLTEFLAKYPGSPIFDKASKGEQNLILFGFVTEVKFFRYQAGSKEAMKLMLYTGEESVEVVVWPGADGSVPVKFMEKVKKNEGLLIQIKPRVRNGTAGYQIMSMVPLGVPKFQDQETLVLEPEIKVAKELKPRTKKELITEIPVE